MAHFEMIIVGEVPSEFNLDPLRRVVEVLNELKPDWLLKGSINLKLVDDAEIQGLNRDYSGNDYATDVLSFSYIEGEERPVENELGDMIISHEMAKRQADEAGTTLADELATLGLHGILHTYGFDHQSQEEQQQMDTLQREILTAANVDYRNFGWQRA